MAIVFGSYLKRIWVVFSSWLQTWVWPRHGNLIRMSFEYDLKRICVLFELSWLGNRTWIVFESYLKRIWVLFDTWLQTCVWPGHGNSILIVFL